MYWCIATLPLIEGFAMPVLGSMLHPDRQSNSHPIITRYMGWLFFGTSWISKCATLQRAAPKFQPITVLFRRILSLGSKHSRGSGRAPRLAARDGRLTRRYI